MFAVSRSVFFYKLQEKEAVIQVSTNPGVPKIIISGMANRVLKESKDRIVSCLKSLQIKLKSCRMVVNLMPTDIPKKDNHMELALIAAILASYGLITIDSSDCFIGSVGLRGEVCSTAKVIALVLAAKKMGFNRVFVSIDDMKKIQLINDLQIVGLSSVSEILTGSYKSKINRAAQYSVLPDKKRVPIDALLGNESSIRALQIAAVGGHHLFLCGPPGYGKTLLAHCLQSIMPPLSYDQLLIVAKTYSLAETKDRVSCSPPFRKLDLNATAAALMGNADREQVGELQLSSQGVLFLDEINNYAKDVLSVLTTNLNQYLNNYFDPNFNQSAFMLVAAANPCPCGYFGTQAKACSCSQWSRQRYQQKLSGALLDRIDLFVDVEESVINESGLSSRLNQRVERISQQVLSAREMLIEKNKNINYKNSSLLRLADSSLLSSETLKILNKAKINLKLSNRLIFKTIRIAQTIACLEGNYEISKENVFEALSYRRKV